MRVKPSAFAQLFEMPYVEMPGGGMYDLRLELFFQNGQGDVHGLLRRLHEIINGAPIVDSGGRSARLVNQADKESFRDQLCTHPFFLNLMHRLGMDVRAVVDQFVDAQRASAPQVAFAEGLVALYPTLAHRLHNPTGA